MSLPPGLVSLINLLRDNGGTFEMTKSFSWEQSRGSPASVLVGVARNHGFSVSCIAEMRLDAEQIVLVVDGNESGTTRPSLIGIDFSEETGIWDSRKM